jgi:hypothetical protein
VRRRVTIVGWLLLAAVIVTAVLAVVAPGAALVMGIVLALAVATALADSFGAPISWFDIGEANERKREALTRRFERGRPEWESTAPDHADESQDAIFERERERRGLR